MKTKNLSVLFALLVILFSMAACTPAPKVSNFYMATDDQGAYKTASFAPTDAFNLFFDVNGITAGTIFETRWYVFGIPGHDPNLPFKTVDETYTSGSTTLLFHLANTANWPIGQYRVDVYMSGNKVGEVPFTVSP
jgi:hypothetical protein